MVKERNQQIANWCRLLMECVYCFGDVLINQGEEVRYFGRKWLEKTGEIKYKLYHNINCKLAFERMDFQFDAPLSMTSNLQMVCDAKQDEMITLQFEKTHNRDICNFYLDLTDFSQFPAECECLVFGAKLGCTDIMFDGLSHDHYIMALRLYQKIICGEWIDVNSGSPTKTTGAGNLADEKYQRRVMKLIKQMLNLSENQHYKDRYIPYLFASITKNVSFGRKVIWLNTDECEQVLLPQLTQLLFHAFAKYVRSAYGIETKFCNVLQMRVDVEKQLSKSSRKRTICSKEYRYRIRGNGDEIVLHCRCFKQFSKVKQQDMFNAYLGIKSLPKSVSMLKVYGGLLMPQMQFEKWYYFYLSHKQLNNGGALFSVNKLKDVKLLNVKICFQVWNVLDANGQPLY